MSPFRFRPTLRLQPWADQVLIWDPGAFQPVAVPVAEFLGWDRALGAIATGGKDGALPPDLAGLRPWIERIDHPSAPPCTLADLPPGSAQRSLPDALRTTGGFCVQSIGGEWGAWSPALRTFIRLPPGTLAIVLACAGGRLSAELASLAGPGGEALLAGLVEAGMLQPFATVNRAPAPASLPVEAARLVSGDPWAGLRADGRRPVYFVTHHVDHLPLALGMLRASLEAYRDGALLKHYLPLPIVALDVKGMQNLFRRFGPGVWLFSSYLWSEEHNRGLSQAVKHAHAGNVTIHGGPSAPKYEAACHDFLKANPHADFVVRGEGEETLAELLAALAHEQPQALLPNVAGITYFSDAGRTRLMRTADRPRLQDLDTLPSPYLGGHFDHYGDQVIAAILETNRGCPYGCTFCDWGSATAQKIRRFDLERVKAEIDWIGRNRIRVLWIADANFGIFQRDIDIARHVAQSRQRHGFPREVVVNYPKNATGKIAEIVKIFAAAGICGQGIISIQTTDPATLSAIRRDNIQTRKYDELGEIFRRESLPLSTDLMIGLPGATVQSFKADLQYYFDDDVGVKAYRTQLLPNSPMADPQYLRAHAIKVDAQQYLVSTRSYSEADLGEMLAIWNAFDIADGYAVLRYALRFLQWDHGLPATEVVHALVTGVNADPARFPAIAWVLRHFLRTRQVLGGWEPFYREFADFVRERFGVDHASDWATTLEVNRLMMPQPGRRFPEEAPLAHDFAGYFRDHVRTRAGSSRRLAEYPPGVLPIADPYRMCETDYSAIEQYDNHQVFYELAAPIARRRSAPNFVIQPVPA